MLNGVCEHTAKVSQEKEIDKEELKKTVRSEFNSFAGIRNLKQGNWNMASVDEWLDTVIDRAADRVALKEKVKGMNCSEAKVSVFGKRMDSWEARTYDEKALVNAVLKDVLALLHSPEKK